MVIKIIRSKKPCSSAIGWQKSDYEGLDKEEILSHIGLNGGWIGQNPTEEFIICDIDDKQHGEAIIKTYIQQKYGLISTPNGYQFI